MKVLDLFSGIGGFSLGLERAGMETVAFCEIDPFPRKILRKHWGDNIPIYEDVRNVTRERLDADGIFPDVITGGFPCQDISLAGKKAGIGEGTRSGLWSECARILGEFRPRYAIFENVTALLSGNDGRWFQRVLWDISQVGYDAEWHCIPASELGAHHHRDRVWIIACPRPLEDSDRFRFSESHDERQQSRGAEIKRPGETLSSGCYCADTGAEEISADVADTEISGNRICFAESIKRQKSKLRESLIASGGIWADEPDVGRVANGIPQRSHRLKVLGNAVVPQIPEIIGRAIINHEVMK